MNRKIIFASIGVLIGIAAIVFGIVCLSMEPARIVSKEYYGGDAYTGIQHAAAQTATNVKRMFDLCRLGFGFSMIVAGCVIILVNAKGFFCEEKKLDATNE